jgi:CelD/BcsL family acetyltransferase involved in cellulose biosynthesis
MTSESFLRAAAQFEAHIAQPHRHDERVRATPDVDQYCSSSHWTLSAYDAFSGRAQGLLYEEADASVLVYETMYNERVRARISLDAMWGLASSVTWNAARPLQELLAQVVLSEGAEPLFWYLTGIPTELLAELHYGDSLRNLGVRVRSPGQSTRMIASLDSGFDGFLGRRSRKFRKGLRSSTRRCHDAGIELRVLRAEDSTTADALFHRCLRVESESWKGAGQCGFAEGPMFAFVQTLCRRSATGPGVDFVLAERDGQDVAFLIGVQHGGVFRGVQMSYDRAWRSLGLGSVLQSEAIRLAAERGAERYDLGSEGLAYKADWAESTWTTWNLTLQTARLSGV